MTDNKIGSERHRFCPSCGTEAVTGASFCGRCGNSLTNLSADSVDAKGDVVTKAGGASQSSDPTWDFTGWDAAIPGELTEALVEMEIPHRWDGSVLSTDPDDEADVDALLDELAGLPKVPQPEASTDVVIAYNTQVSSDVVPVKTSRKWFWPVGVAAILLIAAGVIFGVPQIRHDVLGNGSATQASFGVPCSQNPACSGGSGNTSLGNHWQHGWCHSEHNRPVRGLQRGLSVGSADHQ